jgi:hypothetical protein
MPDKSAIQFEDTVQPRLTELLQCKQIHLECEKCITSYFCIAQAVKHISANVRCSIRKDGEQG